MNIQASDVAYKTDNIVSEAPIPTTSQESLAQQAVVTTSMPPGMKILRRELDLICSVILLILTIPLFAIFAILIKLDSSGPVFFKQIRVGESGRLFCFYKFRSMVVDAEAQRTAREVMNEASGLLFKIKRGPRTTRYGQWMRKFSIDELPQLVNVLHGDMSLVGPRPALPREVEEYNDYERIRLAVKPGITGLWQVSGRSDLSFEQSIALDIEYVNHQSLWLDVVILFRTFNAVLTGRGAY